MNKPKVQIVIPCINLWSKYTLPCIESIKTKYEYRILLIDNASVDETLSEASKLVSNNFSHLRNTESWCCAKSWNHGIRDGFDRGYDYILILNNDVLLHPEAIDRLVERFEEAKRKLIAIHTPTNANVFQGEQASNTLDVVQVTKVYESTILAMATCLDVHGETTPIDIFTMSAESKKDVPESEHPCFSGFMINKECWEKVGKFDENFKPAYFEDNDYHRRINLANMKAIVLPTALFYHYGNGTQREAKPGQLMTSSRQFEMNRLYYCTKWGGLPGKETYSKPFNEEPKI